VVALTPYPQMSHSENKGGTRLAPLPVDSCDVVVLKSKNPGGSSAGAFRGKLCVS